MKTDQIPWPSLGLLDASCCLYVATRSRYCLPGWQDSSIDAYVCTSVTICTLPPHTEDPSFFLVRQQSSKRIRQDRKRTKKGTLGKSWNYIKTRTIVLFFPEHLYYAKEIVILDHFMWGDMCTELKVQQHISILIDFGLFVCGSIIPFFGTSGCPHPWGVCVN